MCDKTQQRRDNGTRSTWEPSPLAFRVAPKWGSYSLHIVGWKHAGVAGPFNSAVHPAIINLLHVDDGVTVLKGDLILICCIVVIDCSESFLKESQEKGREVSAQRSWRIWKHGNTCTVSLNMAAVSGHCSHRNQQTGAALVGCRVALPSLSNSTASHQWDQSGENA